MGLIERIAASRDNTEQRVLGGVPWRPWDSPYWRFSQGGPVHPTRAVYGVDKALGLPALYACVRLIADSTASLPLKIYTTAGSPGRGVRYEGPSIFDQPSADGTIYDWIFQCMTSLLLHGNAWGLITGRDGYGFPTGIEWLPPDMVDVQDDPKQPWNKMRTRVFVFGRQMDNWREELFHVKAFSMPGRTEGISPLRAFALTILNGMEAARYGTDWFAAGGFPPGTFVNTEIEIDATAAAEIRESLTTAIRNRQPLVYGRDWEYKPVVVPPSEAQFIEALQINATQIASIYGLPAERVGGLKSSSLSYCVDGETEILTRRGWLRYDQVTTADTCLGLDTETGLSQWQPVQAVNVFDDGPYDVIRLENSTHSSVTTPNHRWPTVVPGRDQIAWYTTSTLLPDAQLLANETERTDKVVDLAVTHETADLVWCPTTPSGTWFARRHGTTYFTGNTNVEMSALQIIEALRPWLVRLETAFFALLPASRYTRFYTDALLKTDLASRANIYKIFRDVGIRTVDELRELEDLEPMPKGVGSEAIPHEIMVQLVRAGVVQGVPTSLLPALTLDTDLLIPVLQKLQAQGLAAPAVPGKPPVQESAEGQVGMSIDKLRGFGDIDPVDVDQMVAILQKAARKQRLREQQASGPDYIGPWIPSDEELARLTAANGNGNGHGGHG